MTVNNRYIPINLIEIATRNAVREANTRFSGYEETKGESSQERTRRIFTEIQNEIETPQGVIRSNSPQDSLGSAIPTRSVTPN